MIQVCARFYLLVAAAVVVVLVVVVVVVSVDGRLRVKGMHQGTRSFVLVTKLLLTRVGN